MPVVRAEGIGSFAGQPLSFHDEVLGVLGLFSRSPLDDEQHGHLRIFADHAAVALANARAFEEIAHLRRQLEKERDYLRDEIKEVQAFGEIIGDSDALRTALQQIELVAPTQANVLILGESGTGKELVARAIHDRSSRQDRPMVRVIAATNRDLKVDVEAGTFRRDLYFRLSVFPIQLPPLRDRKEDIAPLADHFLRLCSGRLGRKPPRLRQADLRKLQAYSWPGNIRELQNVLDRAVILSASGRLQLEGALPAMGALHAGSRQTSPDDDKRPAFLTDAEMQNLERRNLRAALKAGKGKIYGPDGRQRSPDLDGSPAKAQAHFHFSRRVSVMRWGTDHPISRPQDHTGTNRIDRFSPGT